MDMKVAISCVSPLVQSSLNFFLKDLCVSEVECDFIITDDEQKQGSKPLCLVIDEPYSHIRKPFSEKTLQEDLKAFCEKLQYSSKYKKEVQDFPQDMKPFSPPMSPPSYPQSKEDSLEEQIYRLCEQSARELTDKILALLKSKGDK